MVSIPEFTTKIIYGVIKYNFKHDRVKNKMMAGCTIEETIRMTSKFIHVCNNGKEFRANIYSFEYLLLVALPTEVIRYNQKALIHFQSQSDFFKWIFPRLKVRRYIRHSLQLLRTSQTTVHFFIETNKRAINQCLFSHYQSNVIFTNTATSCQDSRNSIP